MVKSGSEVPALRSMTKEPEDETAERKQVIGSIATGNRVTELNHVAGRGFA